MTKATMIRNYRKYSGADNYIIGFTYKKQLYFVRVDELMPRQMTITTFIITHRTSTKTSNEIN